MSQPRLAMFDMDRTLLEKETASLYVRYQREIGEATIVDLLRTLGCRHSNPNICKNNATPGKCAFVRDDGVCLTPPMSWKRIYQELGGQ